MKICVVVGTRPEIIKMSPVIRALEKRGSDFFILHTGQHYSHNMDGVFFDQLRLPQPGYNLGVGSGTHAEETARMLVGIEKILSQERPDIVLVEGDTNSVLAGSLAASKMGTPVGHVEAGLRSRDRTMPEEINRVVADHLSDLLFAPTENARRNLLEEGIPVERVFVTGNTIVDAVQQNLDLAPQRVKAIPEDGKYFLTTVHRQENVDRKERFQRILEGLSWTHSRFGVPIIYPIHPRARKQMEEYRLSADGISLAEPFDYLSFLRAESRASLVLTDSGGVQEESCILGVPCVTLRDNTERPETLEAGSNVLAGTEPKAIVEKASTMYGKEKNWRNPFGDGSAGKKIVELLDKHFG